jgi:hypothetical protein
MKISQREVILGVLTLAAVLGGSTWYMVDKKTEEWKGKANAIEKLNQQISLHKKAIKMQENWLGELNKLQSQLPIFDTKKRSIAPELVKMIKIISNKHGVDILKNSPYPEKKIDDLYELGINITWQGKLSSMVNFLTEIQQQGVRYDVRSLTVSPVGKNTGKLKGNMVIQCAYLRKPTLPKKK